VIARLLGTIVRRLVGRLLGRAIRRFIGGIVRGLVGLLRGRGGPSAAGGLIAVADEEVEASADGEEHQHHHGTARAEDDRQRVRLLRDPALRGRPLTAGVAEARREGRILPVAGVRRGLAVAGLLPVALLRVLSVPLRAVAAVRRGLSVGISGGGLAPSALRWLRHVLLRRRAAPSPLC